MDSNHEETSCRGISKLLILQFTRSHQSHVIDCIRTAFVHGGNTTYPAGGRRISPPRLWYKGLPACSSECQRALLVEPIGPYVLQRTYGDFSEWKAGEWTAIPIAGLSKGGHGMRPKCCRITESFNTTWPKCLDWRS